MMRDYHARDFPNAPSVPDCEPLGWGWLEDLIALRLFDDEDAGE